MAAGGQKLRPLVASGRTWTQRDRVGRGAARRRDALKRSIGVADQNDIIGEADERSMNLVLNGEIFTTELERFR